MTSTDRALRLLRLWGWVGVGFGTLAVLIGLSLIVVDQADHADDLDGLGAFVGMQVGIVGVIATVVGALVLWWRHRHALAAAWLAVGTAFVIGVTGVLGNLTNPIAVGLVMAIAAALAAPGVYVVTHPPEA